MKYAKLLHNPNAGEQELSKEELMELIQKEGFECDYTPVSKNAWKNIDPEVDFLIISGGDGTIRKVVKKLLDRKLLDKKLPIALLPLGTANNIAKTLKLDQKPEDVIAGWNSGTMKRYDIGRIYNVPKAKFFLEGFGFGIFPALIKQMKKVKDELKETSDEKLEAALEVLAEIVASHKPQYCYIQADGADYSGNYLMVEIMNITSIGPNLHFAENADPGDGFLELVLVSEAERDQMATYVANKIKGIEATLSLEPLKVKKIRLKWEGNLLHVDDKVLKNDQRSEVKLEIHAGSLDFMVGNAGRPAEE